MPCFTPNRIMGEDPLSGYKGLITVPCGQCLYCLKQRSDQWAFRLYNESMVSRSTYFLTLTYNDGTVPRTEDGLLTLDHGDWKLFVKRLRKIVPAKLKYFMCGEYGDTYERPHYHAMMFGLDPNTYKARQQIARTWQQGFIVVEKPRGGAAKYCAKYVMKQTRWDREDRVNLGQKPAYCAVSQHLGISFIENPDNIEYIVNNLAYRWRYADSEVSIPRYYWKKMLELGKITENQFIQIRAKKLQDGEEQRQEKFPNRKSWDDWQYRQVRRAEQKRKQPRGPLD